MEKCEYKWKYDNLVNECVSRLLETLKEHKVERIDFNGKCGSVVWTDGDVITIFDKVFSIERFDYMKEYDQYRITFPESIRNGYFSKEFGVEFMERQYIFEVYAAVIEAIENGNYEINEK